MITLHDITALQKEITSLKAAGKRVGLVPTMGALHEGHLSLVRDAKSKTDYVVVSIFVNPTQFGPNEDFAKYPRTLDDDLKILKEIGTDLVFVPEIATMYPVGCDTIVVPGKIALPFEGEHRGGHFSGVATIVLKLFNAVLPDVAFFGQKDYQQVCVVRKMVRDLLMPVEIAVCPTVREPDGLAMSSRNRYLSEDERKQALVLSKSLAKAEEMILREKVLDLKIVRRELERIINTAKDLQIDYIGFADPTTLETLETYVQATGVVVLLAVRIGTTRLIDNKVIKF